MRDVKIYTYPKSRSLRVLWTLEEIGAPYTAIKTDLLSRQPQVKSPHPFGKVPYLTSQDISLGETLAICMYLCETLTSGTLYPETPADKATVNSWLSFALTDLESPVWHLLKQLVFVPEDQRNHDLVSYFREETRNAVSRITFPPGQDWITGNTFTLADIFVSHTLQWAKFCGIFLHEQLETYLSNAMNRPAFVRAEEKNNR